MRRLLIVVMVLTGVVTMPRAAVAGDRPREVESAALRESDVDIFLYFNIKPAQVARVRARIRAIKSATKFAFVSQRAAATAFHRAFPDDPSRALVDQHRLASFFRVKLSDPSRADSVAGHFLGASHVDRVAVAGRSGDPQRLCDGIRPQWHQFDVVLFMKVVASEGQIEAVRSYLQHSTDVVGFKFLDKVAALHDFKQVFRQSPKLLNGMRAADLPTSFRVALSSAAARDRIETAFKQLRGSDVAVFPSVVDILCTRPVIASPQE